jgi:hypothetical protein
MLLQDVEKDSSTGKIKAAAVCAHALPNNSVTAKHSTMTKHIRTRGTLQLQAAAPQLLPLLFAQHSRAAHVVHRNKVQRDGLAQLQAQLSLQ